MGFTHESANNEPGELEQGLEFQLRCATGQFFVIGYLEGGQHKSFSQHMKYITKMYKERNGEKEKLGKVFNACRFKCL